MTNDKKAAQHSELHSQSWGNGDMNELVEVRQRMAELVASEIECQRAQEALRETRDYLENLFNYANAPIIVWDPAFRITRFNHAFERLTGYTAGEVVGRELRLLFPEASRDESLSKIARALSGEYWESVEIPILRQDGETRLALWNSANIYAEDGTTLMATIAQGVDITERKQAEEALRQRTIELQARNEELDAFAHTVAHDLRSPLTLITGFAELLEYHCAAMLDEEWQNCLHSIVQNGRKMSSLIDGLLLLAGVRKMEVEMGPLDMASIVAEAQQRLAHVIEEHQAEIVLPAAWPVALGYGPWVEELWANYLSNAIKYGGRPPRVELGATVQSDGMACFWVRDNGPGLTPEEQARLFTPFTRLDQISAKGYGLGLSIVRRIVGKLGGQAAVETEIGRGSVFTFTLPAPP